MILTEFKPKNSSCTLKNNLTYGKRSLNCLFFSFFLQKKIHRIFTCRVCSCGCDIKWQMLSPHLLSVLEKLWPPCSLVKGQQEARREHLSLAHTHILLPRCPSLRCYTSPSFFLSVSSFLLLYWLDSRGSLVFRGRGHMPLNHHDALSLEQEKEEEERQRSSELIFDEGMRYEPSQKRWGENIPLRFNTRLKISVIDCLINSGGSQVVCGRPFWSLRCGIKAVIILVFGARSDHIWLSWGGLPDWLWLWTRGNNAVAQGQSQHLLSEGRWFDSPVLHVSVSFSKKLNPKTAPDVQLGTLHGSYRHHFMNLCVNYCKTLWTKASDKCPKM